MKRSQILAIVTLLVSSCSDSVQVHSDADTVPDGDTDTSIADIDADMDIDGELDAEIDAQEDFCDGIDDNSNGRVDEGCLCENGWILEYAYEDVRLRDVWVNTDGTAWAVGHIANVYVGVILYYDGREWIETETDIVEGALNDIWGVNEREVYAVGLGDQIRHFDGDTWTVSSTTNNRDFRRVWASTEGDVFVTCFLSRISHFNGIDWTIMEWDNLYWFDGIWGWNSNVFLAGERSLVGDFEVFEGVVLLYDGLEWEDMYVEENARFDFIYGFSSESIGVVRANSDILVYDGQDWSLLEGHGGSIEEFWGSSLSDFYTVGARGDFAHFTGGDWEVTDIGTEQDLNAIHGSSMNNIMIVTDTSIYHRCGDNW